MSFMDGNGDVLESLVNEMYARCPSTRDVKDAFRDATGGFARRRADNSHRLLLHD